MAEKFTAPHGARGPLYAPAWHRPFLRYIDGDQGGGTGGDGGEQQGTGGSADTDWKSKYEETLGHSRKWEQRAKENADAARRLADLEGSQKTAATQTAERITALEKQLADSQREALLRRVQASHGISDDDAALFLTGEDEKTLNAQAKRLAERTPAGPVAPREGTPRNSSSDEPMREIARRLFNSEE